MMALVRNLIVMALAHLEQAHLRTTLTGESEARRVKELQNKVALTDPVSEGASTENRSTQMLRGEGLQQSTGALVYVYPLEEFDPGARAVLRTCARPGADYFFLEQQLRSPGRVQRLESLTPEERGRTTFVVPCLFETRQRCLNPNPNERPPLAPEVSLSEFGDVNHCLEKVRRSDTFASAGGKRHVWVYGYWDAQFPQVSRNPLLRGFAVGSVERVDATEVATSCKRGLPDHCSFVVPFPTDIRETLRPTFEQWDSRTKLVSYKFGTRRYQLKSPGEKGAKEYCEEAVDATPLRERALDLAKVFDQRQIHTSIAKGRVPLQMYENALSSSKFCMVIRGDTPSTHSFYDSLEENCVPIIISDRFLTVAAPFRKFVDYKSFTVSYSEKEWAEDVNAVADRIEQIDHNATAKRDLFNNMIKYKPMLLWGEGSQVGQLALDAAQSCFS